MRKHCWSSLSLEKIDLKARWRRESNLTAACESPAAVLTSWQNVGAPVIMAILSVTFRILCSGKKQDAIIFHADGFENEITPYQRALHFLDVFK